jgi:hypothetical protein
MKRGRAYLGLLELGGIGRMVARHQQHQLMLSLLQLGVVVSHQCFILSIMVDGCCAFLGSTPLLSFIVPSYLTLA